MVEQRGDEAVNYGSHAFTQWYYGVDLGYFETNQGLLATEKPYTNRLVYDGQKRPDIQSEQGALEPVRFMQHVYCVVECFKNFKDFVFVKRHGVWTLEGTSVLQDVLLIHMLVDTMKSFHIDILRRYLVQFSFGGFCTQLAAPRVRMFFFCRCTYSGKRPLPIWLLAMQTESCATL